MNAATKKLAIKLGDAELAAKLVEEGFNNPAKIRAAADEDLVAIKGIGKAKKDQVRGKFPRRA